MLTQLTLLFALFQGSASPPPDNSELVLSDQDQNIMRRFDSLPSEEKQRIAEELQQEILHIEHPLCDAAQALLDDRKLRNVDQVQKGPLQVYDAKEYAPKLRLKTRTLTDKSKIWRSFRKKFFPIGLPDRNHLWDWDYGLNRLLKPPTRAPRDVVIDLLYGRWPQDGKLAAYAEGALDRNNGLDASADYFAHAYRDRNGKVYQGIPLYEIWNAQTTFGISDVESIAFLRLVVNDTRLTSPIPGKEHDGIYTQIEEHFEIFREYRSLRSALAQRFLDPNGVLPTQFQGIAANLDKAWVLMEHKPRRMAKMLERHPTRKSFLSALSKELEALGTDKEVPHWSEHWQARNSLPGIIRATTLDFLADEGLLGFRRR
ncbi:MAG: hypothetical protein QF489_07245 [Planctomycetota bacterium]|nr:hypothetical protein [Planctomycetota bacterium]